MGLQNRGIQDIKYQDGALYVATKYVVDESVGLFLSYDRGTTWAHNENISFGINTVETTEDILLVGGTNHGIWKSTDNGVTWQQTLGAGFYGPEIHEIKLLGQLALATGTNTVYTSYDQGSTWTEIPYLANRQIRNILIENGFILAGSASNQGVYLSVDNGLTWNKINSFPSDSAGDMLYFAGVLYVGGINAVGDRTIFASKNIGETWEDTFLTNPESYANVKSLERVYSDNSMLFAVTDYGGVYKRLALNKKIEKSPFLEIPWNYKGTNELIDRVTSYFDHEYPLLGYNYYTEPVENTSTTVLYTGSKATQPEAYYSSHDGYDFALPYGTYVRAPAAGVATYSYCTSCGHTIKIDHENGYQTTYMHLQSEDLITSDPSVPADVIPSKIIGRVGLSGNTSGPHLHFVVTKDVDNDGTFANDFPYGKTDPMGWQDRVNQDPWANYVWTDALGVHKGTSSQYLWKNNIANGTKQLQNQNEYIKVDNKKLTKLDPESTTPLVVKIAAGSMPIITPLDTLRYITNTATAISIYNNIEEKIKTLSSPARLEIALNSEYVDDIILDSIKIYHYNETLKNWEPLETLTLDLVPLKISALVDTFSKFAVFGEKKDTSNPETQINIEGSMIEGWYKDFPTISFETLGTQETSPAKTFYNLSTSNEFVLYTAPFSTTQEGVYGIRYYSVDETGNREKEKDELIRVDTKNKRSNVLRITDTTFAL